MTTTTEQRTCEQHGDYTAREYFRGQWSMCPRCAEEAEARREAAAKQAQRADRERQLLADTGIIGRFEAATLESFQAETPQQRAVLRSCREYVENFDQSSGAGLFLIGPPGTGKTHLGCAMTSAIVRKHLCSGMVTSASNAVRSIRETWRRDADRSETAAIEDMAHRGVLVLDEVGAGFDTDAARAQLFEVIDLRYAWKVPTIVLSNLSMPKLRDALGDRSYDRLREGASVLVCDWPSHRGRSQSV